MSTYKTLDIGETYDFSGLRGMEIPVGAKHIYLRATLALPPARPPGSLWPIVGPAFGNVDRKRVKPATLGINNRETWRLEGPGIQGEQTGSVSKVPWGTSGILLVLWEPDIVRVAFNGEAVFDEGLATWNSSKGGILWFGVDPGGEYSPLTGGMLRVTSIDFGLAGEDPGDGGGGEPADEISGHLANIRGSLDALEAILRAR